LWRLQRRIDTVISTRDVSNIDAFNSTTEVGRNPDLGARAETNATGWAKEWWAHLVGAPRVHPHKH